MVNFIISCRVFLHVSIGTRSIKIDEEKPEL